MGQELTPDRRHPIFIHPHLFVPGGLTSGTLDYETMLRLAELIGQHKPPTTSQGDIDKAGLRIIHKHEIEGAMKETEVLANTTERCLGEFCDLARCG